MKAAVIVLAFVLVLSHPAIITPVLAVDLTVCGVLGWLTWCGLRAAMLPATWRRAA